MGGGSSEGSGGCEKGGVDGGGQEGRGGALDARGGGGCNEGVGDEEGAASAAFAALADLVRCSEACRGYREGDGGHADGGEVSAGAAPPRVILRALLRAG